MPYERRKYPGNPLAEDLDQILSCTAGWDELRGKRIFITGGTGFFGCWFLESFAWANQSLDLNASALVLSREPELLREKVPHLYDDPAIQFLKGDVREFPFPDGHFSHVIHAAATSARATFNNEEPLDKFDALVVGTRRTLDFAVKCKARKFLLTSSGAVYGKQPHDISHLTEEYIGAPFTADPDSAWGEGKRSAEFLCACYARKFGIETKIARCFSFIGPYLPLDIHYAVGNFIRDAFTGGPIRVLGDGSPYRSYLYVSDLMIWLWSILFRGNSCQPYNVGSEKALTIAELATTVAAAFVQPVEVTIAATPQPTLHPHRYIPSTELVRKSLDLREMVSLEDAISRTVSCLRGNQS